MPSLLQRHAVISKALKGVTYKNFKPNYGYENYLDIFLEILNILVKYWISNHRIPVNWED